LPPHTFTEVATGAETGAPVHAAIIAAARAGEPDRYLAALLAPAALRADLLAVAAFAAELARIPLAARRQPALGELRLQWWHEAMLRPPDAATGHPIADRLRAALGRHGIAAAMPQAVLAARAADLEPVPFADDAALDRYLAGVEGSLFGMARRILGAAADGAADRACGQAYGLARLIFALRPALGRGHLPVPVTRLSALGLTPATALAPPPAVLARLVADLAGDARKHLAGARGAVTKLPREQSIAVLPLALVESYLRAGERAARRSKTGAARIAPLTRIGRVAGAHWLRRW